MEGAGQDWEYLNLSTSQWSSDLSLTVQCQNIAQCCPSLTLSSSGEASERFPDMMGGYTQTGSYEQGRPVYSLEGNMSVELRYVEDVAHHWSGWVVGEGMGSLSHDEDSDCPAQLPQGWDVADGQGWVGDDSLSVQCQ